MSARYQSSTATVKDIAAPNRLTPSLLKRKTANNIGRISLLTMVILPGLFSTAGCTEAVKGTEKNGASPVTAENYPSKEAQQAAWNKILPLISKRGGYMEPYELEKALGIKLRDDGSETIKLTVNVHTYTANPSPVFPWNMNIQIFKDKQKIKEKPWSGFQILFRDNYNPKDLSKPCLSAEQILQDLHQNDWRTQGPDLPVPGRIKSNTSLIAKSTTNGYIVEIGTDANLCLDSVTVRDNTKI